MPPAFDGSALDRRRAALAGIGLMVLGIFLFSVNDAMGKWLVATYTVGQVLLIRSLAALVMLAPFVWREGVAPLLRAPWPSLQLLRVVLSTLEVAFFYWAVAYLPLADVMTYYLAAPIYVTALSPVLLGEAVGWRRWTAVLVGFAGVLVALRPSASTLTLPALVAVLGSLIFALMMITTRKLRGTSGTALVTGQTLGALLLGGALAPFDWVTPSPRDFLLLSLLGVAAMVAHVCVNRSLQLAPASVVAPFQYTLIVWAVVLGYLVFGDVPQLGTWIGAGIIVGAGLFIFWREQVRIRAGR
ncbi:MAG: DMT family transporter [Pseudomonadota bacterium]|nr:DMT family transporter [Pseudomonadota bacterium]